MKKGFLSSVGLSGFARNSDGSIAVEFAFAASFMALLMMGVVDFGLAHSKQMAMHNAVRAGTQFALARRPALGPNVAAVDELISIQDIKDKVVEALPDIDTDPGEPALMVAVLCECASAVTVSCDDATVIDGTCIVEATLVQVDYSTTFELIFHIPGIGSQLELTSQHIVRMT